MLRFEHTEHLLLLLLVPLLIMVFRADLLRKRSTMRKIGDESLVRQLIGGFSPHKHRLRFILVIFSFSCLVIAAANIQSSSQTEGTTRQGIDVIVALDVSRSMTATDIKPSRLDRAKQFVRKLMEQLDNDRVGLVVFAGRAYMQMPLTADHAAAGMYISTAGPESVPAQGTVIADALQVCDRGFDKKDDRYKAVVLITDGEDHAPDAVKTAKQLADKGVVIFTLGVGTPQGSTLMNPLTGEVKHDAKGNTVVSRLNEQELSDIAQATKGTYQHLDDTETAVNNMKAQFAGMDKKLIVDYSQLSFRSFFQWFLALAFAGFITELFISERKKI